LKAFWLAFGRFSTGPFRRLVKGDGVEEEALEAAGAIGVGSTTGVVNRKLRSWCHRSKYNGCRYLSSLCQRAKGLCTTGIGA
jgi:hypothetical protein